MNRHGFSGAGLKRIGDAMQARVDRGEIPGAVMLIARHGHTVLFEAFGYRDREARVSMPRDAIFRIASMTKPFTSLAAMMLVEQGRLQLGARVADYLPQLGALKLGVARPDGTLELVSPRQQATVLDLMRHTSGFSYAFTGNSPVKRAYQASGIGSFTGSGTEYLAKVAELPLEFEPGTTWSYSISTDVLGHLVEAVTGATLEEFVASHITGPLGLGDTGFRVDEARRKRLAEPQADAKTGKRPELLDVTKAPPRSRGGGGMVSTAQDYGRFCQFWLNGGALGKVRLVSRKTVELMTADHLPPDIAADPEMITLMGATAPLPQFGGGFGLGFAVRTHLGRAPWHGSVGAYEWAGSTGTVFLVDPAEELLAVTLMQAPEQLQNNMYLQRALVYQALD